MILSDYRLLLARSRLSLIVLDRAAALTKEYGVYYTAVPDAPQTLDECRLAWLHAKRTKTPFPVWSGASDKTIYFRPEDNHAFRFWHAMIHVHGGHGMSLTAELAIASMHVKHVANLYGKDSPEAALMAVDTAGQALYPMVHGSHVPNPLQFARAHFGLGNS